MIRQVSMKFTFIFWCSVEKASCLAFWNSVEGSDANFLDWMFASWGTIRWVCLARGDVILELVNGIFRSEIFVGAIT